jgi:hypothetical protein
MYGASSCSYRTASAITRFRVERGSREARSCAGVTGIYRKARTGSPRCPRCGGSAHDFAGLPGAEHAYLLGKYLGDGTIYRAGRTHALRISSDAQYTRTIEECCDAIETIWGGACTYGATPTSGS